MIYRSFQFKRARDCLSFLIKVYHIREMYIPYYLCSVVRNTAFSEKCTPVFYHINDDFMPSIILPKDSYILYPNYFGVCRKNIRILNELYPKLIIDNAHSFYEKPSGFAAFNSGYKFGKNKAAWVWFSDINNKNLLQGEIYNDKETLPYTNPKEIKLRKEKFLLFHDKLGSENRLNLDIDSCFSPFCYPYLASDKQVANNLVKELETKHLTIYRYWDCLPESFNEYKFYSRLVPIPLD